MNGEDILAIGLTIALLVFLSLAYLYPQYAGGLLAAAIFISLADGYVIHKYSNNLRDFKEFERDVLDVKQYLLQALQGEGSKYVDLVEELIKVEQDLINGIDIKAVKERVRHIKK